MKQERWKYAVTYIFLLLAFVCFVFFLFPSENSRNRFGAFFFCLIFLGAAMLHAIASFNEAKKFTKEEMEEEIKKWGIIQANKKKK